MKKLAYASASLAAALTTMLSPAVRAEQQCYPAPRFKILATEVIDRKTGLTWQRGRAPVRKTWAEAKTYCPMVGANFRLPSVKEIVTIIDLTQSYGIDLIAFPGTPNFHYWTSSPVVGQPLNAWVGGFGEGGSAAQRLVSEPLEVRCVR